MNVFLYRDFDPQILEALAQGQRDFILVGYDLAHPIGVGDGIALRSQHLLMGVVRSVVDSSTNPRLLQDDQEGSALVQMVPPDQHQQEYILAHLDALDIREGNVKKSRIIIPDTNWN